MMEISPKSVTDDIIILSIDPGLSHAGWAISIYNQIDNKLIVKDFGTIESVKITDRKLYRDIVNLFGKRVISLNVIEQEISKIYDKYLPDYVECENAFFNPFRPTAFTALNDFIAILKKFIFDKYNKPLYLISPKSIKSSISDGTAKKEDITSAVKKNEQIIFETETEPTQEHEWDAIAGAFAFVNLYLNKIKNNEPYDVIIASQKTKRKK